MRIPFDPAHFEMPLQLACYILGACASAAGMAVTALVGTFQTVAVIPPEELAVQPLHVVLIGFIVALATFIVLILRAVWGRGLDTVNRFSDAQERTISKMEELCQLQSKRVEKLEELSLAALKDAANHGK